MKRAAIMLAVMLALTACWLAVATPYFARTQYDILIGRPADRLALCETPTYAPEDRPACRAEARDLAAREPEMRDAFWWNSLSVASYLALFFWVIAAGLFAMVRWLVRGSSRRTRR